MEGNFLVPNHKKLSEEQINSLLEKFNLDSKHKLPKIKISDKALSTIENLKLGDVIEIARTSFAGENKYYRLVVE